MHTAIIPENLAKKRLDQALADIFPKYSRSLIQIWLKQGNIKINGQKTTKKDTKYLVSGGEIINITSTLSNIDNNINKNNYLAENIPLDIIYHDDALIIINKPVNMVVHPACGNWDNTLVNALLYHFTHLKNLPRAGIIHRLDKDTSGLLLVANNLTAYNYLIAAMQQRQIKREYYALCHGEIISGGTINAPIGRNPRNRLKMAVNFAGENAKEAITHYRIKQKFPKYTYLKISLETGRTHQIRVHLAHIGYPIVGDKLYNKYTNKQQNFNLPHQALHAVNLSLHHPENNTLLNFNAPTNPDITNILATLSSNEK